MNFLIIFEFLNFFTSISIEQSCGTLCLHDNNPNFLQPSNNNGMTTTLRSAKLSTFKLFDKLQFVCNLIQSHTNFLLYLCGIGTKNHRWATSMQEIRQQLVRYTTQMRTNWTSYLEDKF